MADLDIDAEDEQVLKGFHAVAKSHAATFLAQRDHARALLGTDQNYWSGVFREGLLRNFLSGVLPDSVSVDCGFVYGFGQVPNSKQVDILVWDSHRYAAVYRTREFVIVPPEAVIAAISVKTNLPPCEIRDALDNLLSLAPLEMVYRSGVDPELGKPVWRPVTKVVLAYNAPADANTALATVGAFFEERFGSDAELAREVVEPLRDFNPSHPAQGHIDRVGRVVPKMVAAIDGNFSMVQGWGPPSDILGTGRYGPGLRRLPYFYLQKNDQTSPLEKVVFYIVGSAHLTVGSARSSLVRAWGALNPVTGVQPWDVSELIEECGVRLLNPDKLAFQREEHAEG